jgi:biotin carboxyl carrier protein
MSGSDGAGGVERLELLVERREDAIALLSPAVGLFIAARAEGEVIAAGTTAGVLLALGREIALGAPADVEGRVASRAGALVRQPVGWGDLLYELEPLAGGERASGENESGGGSHVGASGGRAGGGATADARLLFRSPQSGRFYLRPSPSEEPFVAALSLIEDGQPVGLIEVMKTFAHVRYAAAGGLPSRARVARILVEDGAEVGAGDALLEVEPAPAAA